MESRKKRKSRLEDICESPTKKKRKRDIELDKPTESSEVDDQPLRKESSEVDDQPLRKKVISCDPSKSRKNSWLHHIANIVLMRCLEKAESIQVESLSITNPDINWNMWAGSLLTPVDVKTICFYISKEFPEPVDLVDAKLLVKKYKKIDSDSLYRNEQRLKFKKLEPKLPVTAFFQFCKSKMDNLKMKHPTLSAPEITKKLSNKWNSMDDGRKLKYKKRYLEQKEQYTRDKEQFYIEYPEARPPPHHRVRPQRKSETQIQDDRILKEEKLRQRQLIPKAPSLPFYIFCKAKRETVIKKYPKLKSQEITKKLGQKWKSLSEEKKTKYKQIFSRDKEEYDEKIAQLKIDHPDIYQKREEIIKVRKKVKGKRVKLPDKSHDQSHDQSHDEDSLEEEKHKNNDDDEEGDVNVEDSDDEPSDEEDEQTNASSSSSSSS